MAKPTDKQTETKPEPKPRTPKGTGAEVTIKVSGELFRQIDDLATAWSKSSGVNITTRAVAEKLIKAGLDTKPAAPKLTF